MLIPLLPTRIHGFLDYIVGACLICAPYLFSFASHDVAQWSLMGAGLAVIANGLLTDHEASLVRLMPMPLHLLLDIAVGVWLLVTPWLPGFSRHPAFLHLSFGGLIIVTSLVTRRRPLRDDAEGAEDHDLRRADMAYAVLIVLGLLGVSGAFGWVSMVDPVQQGGSAPADVGAPRPWQLNFSVPHSPVQEALFSLHNLLLAVSIAISAFVALLVLYICRRYSARRNPVPTRTSHNTVLEVAWTILPILILVMIAIPTFRNVRMIETPPGPEMTLKVTGQQWSWAYAYPDHGDFAFTALNVADKDLPPERKNRRLMMTDNAVVLPVDTVILVQVTAADVIHAWGVPSLGVMRDAVPGRLNQTWIKIQREGTYYGGCRELCGVNHAFMPIMIEAVSKERFATWVQEARTRFAQGDAPPSPTQRAQAPRHDLADAGETR